MSPVRSWAVSPWRPVIIASILLLATALGAWGWLRALSASARDYRPLSLALPLTSASAPAGERSSAASAPLAQSVALVVVSGLRADILRRMPTLTDLSGRGALADVVVEPLPSESAAWGALLTGAGPELSGAPLLAGSQAPARPLSADTLLASAARAGLSAAVFSRGPWDSLIPDAFMRGGLAPTGFSQVAAADSAATDAARDAVRRGTTDLIVLPYHHVAVAAATFGPESIEYLRAAQTVDADIAALLKDVDLRRTAVVITADRGLSDRATLTDDTPRVPLLILGPQVKPGAYGPYSQADVAPTVAAILGIPPPTHARGITRMEMLDAADGARAQRGIADAAQKIALASALAQSYGDARLRRQVADEADGLRVITTTAELGNDAGAWRLAEPTALAAQGRADEVRRGALDDAADRRLLPALLWGALLLAATLWRVSLTRLALIGAAAVAFVLHLGQLEAQASAFGLSLAAAEITRGMALALLLAGGLGVWWLWARRDPRAARLTAAAGLAVATLAVATLAPPRPVTLNGFLVGAPVARVIVLRAALALAWGAAVTLALVWWRSDDGEAHRLGAARTAGLMGRYAVALAALLSLQLAATWFLVGPTIGEFLPAAAVVFLEGVTLTMLVAVGVGGLLAPWPTAVIYLVGVFRGHDVATEPVTNTGQAYQEANQEREHVFWR
ncbi:MAG: alkaline phosphatase family protein [Anaerolineae bacterium]